MIENIPGGVTITWPEPMLVGRTVVLEWTIPDPQILPEEWSYTVIYRQINGSTSMTNPVYAVEGGGDYNGGEDVYIETSDIIPGGTRQIRYRFQAVDRRTGVFIDILSSQHTIPGVAPTAPAGITVPETIVTGAAFMVYWGESTDPDGNLSGYKLERSLNGGGFAQIYSGTALYFEDVIGAGNATVRYRVKAFDDAGLESSYVTSGTRILKVRYTAADYMSTAIIDKAYQVQSELRELFLELLSRQVTITQPNTGAGNLTVPYADFVNILERNLDALSANGYAPLDMKPTVNWLGELNDIHRLDYTDVNRWFESVELMTETAWAVSYRGLITGRFHTGDDRTRQIFRR